MRKILLGILILLAVTTTASVVMDITSMPTETLFSAGYSTSLTLHNLGLGVSRSLAIPSNQAVTLWAFWEVGLPDEIYRDTFFIGADVRAEIWPFAGAMEAFISRGFDLELHMGMQDLKMGIRLTGCWFDRVEWFLKARFIF